MRYVLASVAVLTALTTGSILWSTTECPTARLRFGTHPNIMCLELAFTTERAASTVVMWSAGDGAIARTAHDDTIGDYAFLAFYGSALAFTGWKASRKLAPGSAFYRSALVKAPIFAALCDALENQGIFRILAMGATVTSPVAFMTGVFASLKFALIAVWIGSALVLASRRPS